MVIDGVKEQNRILVFEFFSLLDQINLLSQKG